MKEEIIELCGYEDFDCLKKDIFLDEKYDDALIGVLGVCNDISPAYNQSEIIKIIKLENNFNREEAINYFNNNILENYPELSFIVFTDGFNSKLPLYNEGILFMDDLSDALIGIRIKKDCDIITVYDETLCVEILTSSIGNEEEAWDYFHYNVTGAYVGVNTPGILTDMT